VPGVIGNTAIHLREDLANEKAPQPHELWVDVGASSAKEVAKLGLRVGHPPSITDEPIELAGGRLVARALDNRIGGYIIARVHRQLVARSQDASPPHRVLCLNAVQEEIGGHGAMMATHRLRPDLCLCLDVTHATDTPGIDARPARRGHPRRRPSLTHGTANHPLVVERLIEVAKDGKIPVQHEASSRFTGTDTDKIFHSRDGVPSALVSLPLRSMHSAVETADLTDIDHTIGLLAAFLLSLKSSDRFHQQL
jgi:putative aminopeptidase FrvX